VPDLVALLEVSEDCVIEKSMCIGEQANPHSLR
jgi:hypothetical protein